MVGVFGTFLFAFFFEFLLCLADFFLFFCAGLNVADHSSFFQQLSHPLRMHLPFFCSFYFPLRYFFVVIFYFLILFSLFLPPDDRSFHCLLESKNCPNLRSLLGQFANFLRRSGSGTATTEGESENASGEKSEEDDTTDNNRHYESPNKVTFFSRFVCSLLYYANVLLAFSLKILPLRFTIPLCLFSSLPHSSLLSPSLSSSLPAPPSALTDGSSDGILPTREKAHK